LYNISLQILDIEAPMPFWDDPYIWTSNNRFFETHMKGQKFVDTLGDIYVAVRRIEPQEWWKRWFSFIPSFWPREIQFEATGERMTVDELRAHIHYSLTYWGTRDEMNQWSENLKKMTTYESLIQWEWFGPSENGVWYD
jgi:hypothetical protein